MLATTQRTLLLVGLLIAHAGSGAGTAHAYTLVDWMRMWPRTSPAPVAGAPIYPVPAAVPAAGALAPPYVFPGVPVTPGCGTAVPPACGTPVPPACGTPLPTAAAPAPANPIAAWWNRTTPQVTVSYVPEVRYRTTWLRVPTTNYRPITNVDPMSGFPSATVMPCTTFSWQIQRVPYTAYRAVYMTAPSAAVMPGCATCAPTTVAPAAPYYAPAPMAVPAMPGPGAAPGLPAAPSLQPMPAAPGGLYNPAPSSAPPSSRMPTPADQQPSLMPGDLQNLPRNSAGRATMNFPTQPSPGTVPLPPSIISPANGGPGTRAEASANPGVQLIPLPDPEARPDRKPLPAAPALFDTHDRTAQRVFRPAGNVAPITWPDAAPAIATRQSPAPETPAVQAAASLDASGWHAVTP